MLKKVSRQKKGEIKERKAFINPFFPDEFMCILGCFSRCDYKLPARDSAECNDEICNLTN